MLRCILATRDTLVQFVIAMTRMMRVTERAAVVMVMIGVAVMPIPVMCPASVCVPPSRPITPVPGTMPCIPCVTPEPIVDNRTIDIYRFDDVVLTIHILVTDYLYGNLVVLIFLHIYRGYILVDILCQYRLQNDQTLVSFAGLYHA